MSASSLAPELEVYDVQNHEDWKNLELKALALLPGWIAQMTSLRLGMWSPSKLGYDFIFDIDGISQTIGYLQMDCGTPCFAFPHDLQWLADMRWSKCMAIIDPQAGARIMLTRYVDAVPFVLSFYVDYNILSHLRAIDPTFVKIGSMTEQEPFDITVKQTLHLITSLSINQGAEPWHE